MKFYATIRPNSGPSRAIFDVGDAFIISLPNVVPNPTDPAGPGILTYVDVKMSKASLPVAAGNEAGLWSAFNTEALATGNVVWHNVMTEVSDPRNTEVRGAWFRSQGRLLAHMFLPSNRGEPSLIFVSSGGSDTFQGIKIEETLNAVDIHDVMATELGFA